MMEPCVFAATMARAACLMVAATPRTLIAMVLSKSSRFMSRMVVIGPMIPALLKRMSIEPYLVTVWLTAASTCFSSLTSQRQ
ncbi:hypothetical protein HanRHA438_Chr04g0186021 [Helianthus annuus]|nr:hypothetical protein HanRHA438_Chr04g0186021 [Helianthus annuus]